MWLIIGTPEILKRLDSSDYQATGWLHALRVSGDQCSPSHTGLVDSPTCCCLKLFCTPIAALCRGAR